MAKILVVDDDKEITDFICHTLRADRHILSVAHNGEDALNLFCSKEFDLIITDIIMPRSDGIDFVSKLEDLFFVDKKRVPIIAISGGMRRITSDFNLDSAAHMGVQYTIKKPFTTEELMDKVNSALSQ